MNFYERLSKCCADAGTTVTAFTVDVLALSKSAPTSWKKGVNLPNADSVLKAAEYFGVSSDYLLGLSDHKCALNDLSDDEAELLTLLRAAHPDDAVIAMNAARAVLETCQMQRTATSCLSTKSIDDASLF